MNGGGATLLLLRARSEYNDVALPCFLVRAGAHACAGVAVEGCIGQVLDLSVTYFFLGVNQKDIARDWIQYQGVCDCCADIASADDGD